jgi:NAD(P)-dependent dehydrogenase (short-subunit alcohol dehydrogenase family)
LITKKDKKENAIAIIGASGGIGYALLQELAGDIETNYFPTYNSSVPQNAEFNWSYYNSGDQDSVQKYFEHLSNYNLTAIIDCSGAFFASSLNKATNFDIEKVISANLIGPFVTAKQALNALAPDGKLILMSSILAKKNVFGSSIYAASKAGLEHGIAVLGEEFSKKNLAICGIRLDYMDYGMTHKINDDVKAKIRNSMPNLEFIKIEELAKIIKLIFSKDSKQISGRTFLWNEKI